MTIKQEIIDLNRTENAECLNSLCCRLSSGRLSVRGLPIIFGYDNMRKLFKKCDPSIDDARFEELMQLADSASK